MTRNICLLATILLFAILFSCKSNAQNKGDTVHLVLDPTHYGWYYIELQKDSAHIMTNKQLPVDSSTRLVKTIIKRLDSCTVTVHNKAGENISSQMKFVNIHETGGNRTFFEFYNPYPQDAAYMKKWNPEDAGYSAIMQKGYLQLKMLLQKER